MPVCLILCLFRILLQEGINGFDIGDDDAVSSVVIALVAVFL